jgi:hypothetical protein
MHLEEKDQIIGLAIYKDIKQSRKSLSNPFSRKWDSNDLNNILYRYLKESSGNLYSLPQSRG